MPRPLVLVVRPYGLFVRAQPVDPAIRTTHTGHSIVCF
jgi:hypothetical protein